MKQEYKIALYAGITIASAAFIYVGFGTEKYNIESCESTISRYVTAEFSETTAGIDFEGNAYIDTDYWSEQASEVNRAHFINEIPVFPPMPEHDTSFKRASNFDNFKSHTDTKLIITAKNMLDSVSFKEPISQAPACIKKLDQFVDVKTWWTIAYSSEF